MNDDAQAGGVKVTDSMIDSLRSTKPWTKLLAILGFVGVGIMILCAALMFFSNMLPSQKGAAPFVGFVYILFAALYFMPAFYLFKYSSSIGNFLESNGQTDLESALSNQKSFWKFAGILALIGMVFVVLGIVAAILIPMVVKMGTHPGM
jgi:amino acid transporter